MGSDNARPHYPYKTCKLDSISSHRSPSLLHARMLEEVTLCLEQVTRLKHHSLCLAQHCEVEHTCLGVALAGVDTLKLRLDCDGDALEELVTHSKYCVNITEVVGCNHTVDAAVDLRHIVVDVLQILGLLLRQALVVVVDVVERRTCDVY